MKRYVWEHKIYFRRVTLAGYFMALVALYCLIMLILHPGINVYLLFLVPAVYGAMNTFFTLSNPDVVEITADTIRFCTGNKGHTYRFDELTGFNIKEFQLADFFFIRVEAGKKKKGRYYVNYRHMNDQQDLFAELYFIERTLHPTALKFSGRPELGAERPPLDSLEHKNDSTDPS